MMKKTTIVAGLLLAALLLLAGCSNMLMDLEKMSADGGGPGGPAGTAAATGVILNRTAATVLVGSGEQLVATVAPADAADRTVGWTSSNGAAATVSASGLVTGVAAGSATITATTTDGGFTATCEVTVVDDAVHVSGASGNDATGVGTRISPYQTLAKALQVTTGTAGAPKYILMAAGTYSLAATLTISETYVSVYGGYNADFSVRNTADRTNPTYRTLVTSTVAPAGQAIFLNGCEYVTLDGLTIESTNASRSTVHSQENYGTSQAITISNCTIKVSGDATQDQVYGINFAGGMNNKVIDCIVDMSGLNPIRYTAGISANTDGLVVTGTTVYTSPAGATVTTAGDIMGISLATDSGGGDHTYRITGNTILYGQTINNTLSTLRGVNYSNAYSFGTQSTVIAGNTIRTSTPVVDCASAYGVTLNPVSAEAALFVVNNTVSLSGTVSTAMGASAGVHVVDNRRADIGNNTIYNTMTGNWTYGVYAKRTYAAADIPVIKNNIIVLTTTGPAVVPPPPNTPVCGVIFNAAYPDTVESNWIYVPNFADGMVYTAGNFTGADPVLDTANDYRLRTTSPADVKAGGENLYAVNAALQKDKAGAARAAAGPWAIGAYNAP